LGFLLLCLVFTYLFGENVGESERELMAIAVREELNAKLNRTSRNGGESRIEECAMEKIELTKMRKIIKIE
jgi:hypothetical protein